MITDPFGSMQNFMAMFNGFRQNPMQMLLQRKMNIPNGMTNPQDMINYMMRTGQISQTDFNNANYMARRVQNNPMFRRY